MGSASGREASKVTMVSRESGTGSNSLAMARTSSLKSTQKAPVLTSRPEPSSSSASSTLTEKGGPKKSSLICQLPCLKGLLRHHNPRNQQKDPRSPLQQQQRKSLNITIVCRQPDDQSCWVAALTDDFSMLPEAVLACLLQKAPPPMKQAQQSLDRYGGAKFATALPLSYTSTALITPLL